MDSGAVAAGMLAEPVGAGRLPLPEVERLLGPVVRQSLHDA